jgi:intracellular septation protein
MKLLFDFFPILLFFVAYKLYGIYTATAVAIAATFVQAGVYRLAHRRFENMHLLTLGIILVFGGATLLLHDETYIKWKPTVLNWLFGAAFLASQVFGRRTLVERMMGATLTAPAPVWARLNLSWVGFFAAMGALNLYVAYQFDTDTWVSFKLFGMMGLLLAFVVAQALYLARHLQEPKEEL